MPFNDTGKMAALDGLDESLAGGVKFIGLFQSSADPGTGNTFTGTEATGGAPAYARLAVTWAAALTPGTKANSGALTFDVPAGSYYAFGLFNAGSGNAAGNFMGYLPFGGAVKGFGEVDSTGVTNDTITSSGHGLTTDDRVMVYNVFAESIPTGLVEGTLYYVLASGLTTDVFKVALTSGGAAINITGQGEVFFQKFVVETFGAQGQITAAVGALVLDATAM